MPTDPRFFALAAHGEQRYGEHPYSVHLDAVAALLEPYGEQARTVGYLHDVVEDTGVTLAQVRANFGAQVADCVELLTDAPGANRQERKAKTYARLAEVSGPTSLALIVKAADRLANVRACVGDRKRGLWEVYRDEHAGFRRAAYRAGLCEPLWAELDGLVSETGYARGHVKEGNDGTDEADGHVKGCGP